MWTRFMDMHSGGDQKENFAYCYIEAPEHEAEIIFQNRFGHNPRRVTCTCCGEDYSIHDDDTLEQATAYDRGCKWDKTLKKYVEQPDKHAFNKYLPLDIYLITNKEHVLIIHDRDIKPEERIGELKQEGYVWID